jgi:hypothetical protein
MSEQEHEQFGKTIANSRWFKGEPSTTRKRLIPYREIWNCPIDGCDGEMIATGEAWPFNPPGYHHRCSKCGFTAAVHARYPRIVHVIEED